MEPGRAFQIEGASIKYKHNVHRLLPWCKSQSVDGPGVWLVSQEKGAAPSHVKDLHLSILRPYKCN